MTCKVCGRVSCTESFHSIQEQEDIEKIQSDRAVDLLAENKKLQKAIAIADNENESRCGLMNIMRSELIIREAEINTLKQQRDDLLAACLKIQTAREDYRKNGKDFDSEDLDKTLDAAITKCET